MHFAPSLAATLALFTAAGDDIWSAYDQFSAPNESCEVTAVVPGPGGSVLLGSTCNRLAGKPIGPVVAVDLTGKALETPFAKALVTAIPDDRMRELSQLIAHGDGFVVTQSSREKGHLRTNSVHFPQGLKLTRINAVGARDEAFSAAVQKALDERLERWALLDVSTDSKQQLIVAAASPPAKDDYLKDAPVRVLRFDGAGAVIGELKFDEALKAMGFGYYEVLMVRARPDGGLFVGGRFQKPKNAHDRLYVVAFDKDWKPDAKFNGPFQKAHGKGNGVEIRLLIPDDKGGAWIVGDIDDAHVARLTAAGALDPSFKRFKLPGEYPQGRFMRPGLVARAADNALWVSFGALPGKEPPWAAPGLVKLDAKGVADAKVARALGKGFSDERSKTSESDEARGWMSAVAPLPDGSLVISGKFDHLGDAAVKSPVRLKADGTHDPGFAPKLSTELPAKPPPEPNAKTSEFFKADGKQHFIECKKDGQSTFMVYDLGKDPWGHEPACYVSYGHGGTPGGAWQHCDRRVKKLKAQGATCAETKKNPLGHDDGHF